MGRNDIFRTEVLILVILFAIAVKLGALLTTALLWPKIALLPVTAVIFGSLYWILWRVLNLENMRYVKRNRQKEPEA